MKIMTWGIWPMVILICRSALPIFSGYYRELLPKSGRIASKIMKIMAFAILPKLKLGSHRPTYPYAELELQRS